jgi:hypothetical protein
MNSPPIQFDCIVRSGELFLPSEHQTRQLVKSGLFALGKPVFYPSTDLWNASTGTAILKQLLDLLYFPKSNVLIVSDLFHETAHHEPIRSVLHDIYGRYKYVIQFIKEPAYGKLGNTAARFCSISGRNLLTIHEDFLSSFAPDLVGYPSPVDTSLSVAKDVFFNTSMIDSFMDDLPDELSLENIRNRESFIYSGSVGGWPNSYKGSEGGEGGGRPEFYHDFRTIIRRLGPKTEKIPPVSLKLCTQKEKVNRPGSGSYPLSYRALSNLIRGFKYQIDPPNGYHFYPLRSVQSWFNNVIPFVFLGKDFEDEFNRYYKDLPIKDGENCLFANEDNLEKKIKEALDPDLIIHLLSNIEKMDLYDFSTEKMINELHSKTLAALK